MIPLNADYDLREATPDDVPRIAEIWVEGVEASFGDSALDLPPLASVHEQLLKLVQQQTENFKFWLCIDHQGEVVGWSTVQPFHTTPLESARNCYGFISTYMSSTCQGRGTGTQLMQFTMDYCRKHTSIVYVLGIQDRSNVASVKMTDRAGFREFGKLPVVEGVLPCSLIICTTT